ncbi:MAG: nuclear protein [Candidatus Berkelbacteria bacterium]|nr:nuclear protein [Candidatus Berkelbacteria bacterium]
MEAAKALALTSLVIYLFAFGLYNRQIITGKSKPNAAMWTLWVFLAGLNAASYQVMTGDWVKSLITYAGCVAMTTTFLITLRTGKFSRLGSFDWILLGLGFVAILAWWVKQDATYANMLLQLAIAISFVPTYMGVWQKPANERPLPWVLFSLGYVFQTLVVVTRWTGQIQDLVYPINCFTLHLVVGLLSLRRST